MYVYMSLDPGTNAMGVTINGIEPGTLVKRILHTTSVNIKDLTPLLFSKDMIEFYGPLRTRVLTCERVVDKFLRDWRVRSTVSEAPFLGRFPAAGIALTTCVNSYSSACYKFDPNHPFDTIDPPTVKKAVGVPGNSGDKELMRAAVKRMFPEINTDGMDEHAIDSVAVGHAWYLNFMNRNN